MKAEEPALALDAIEGRVPFDGLAYAGDGAHDERVEAAPDVAFPAWHGRDVGLHRGVAVGLRDLRVAACDSSFAGRLDPDFLWYLGPAKWMGEGIVDSRDFLFATCAADAPSFALKGAVSISPRKSPATLRQRGKAREEAPEGARLLNALKPWRKQVIRWKST